jgi:hypothetical protein
MFDAVAIVLAVLAMLILGVLGMLPPDWVSSADSAGRP